MSVLGTAVITRIGAQRLVELTQEDGTAVIVDTDVLEAACDDATGDFQRMSGVIADTGNSSHLSILVQGVIFFLEDYKSRDSGMMTGRGKRFYGALKGLQDMRYMLSDTNSTLVPTPEKTNARPDFDRGSKVWSAGRRTIKISEIAEDE